MHEVDSRHQLLEESAGLSLSEIVLFPQSIQQFPSPQYLHYYVHMQLIEYGHIEVVLSVGVVYLI